MPFKHLTCLASPENGGHKGNAPALEQLQLVPADNAPSIPEIECGFVTVALQKLEGVGLGLTVSGGVDKEYKTKISAMKPNGIAAMSDRLQVGDHITSVNCIKTSKMKHAEVISLLKHVGQAVTLEIQYRLPPTCVATPTIAQKTVDITLTKEDGGFGFILRGGHNAEDETKRRSLMVTHIRAGSSADVEGTLKTGDRLKCVNGLHLYEMALENVYDMMKEAQDTAAFTIEYDVSVMDAVNNATGPLLVEVSKTPGSNLGILPTSCLRLKKCVICIEKILPASIADRCGALHVGDQLLSIDGVSLVASNISVEDASKMLQSNGDHIRIEILPFTQLSIEAPKNLNFHSRIAPTITSAQSLSALNFSRRPRSHRSLATSMFGGGSNAWNRAVMYRSKYAASAISLASVDFPSSTQVVRAENLEVCLLAADDDCPPGSAASSCFGIQLQGGVFATEVLTSPPAIAFIESDSAAEKCGRIQVGDRLVSINGRGTEDETLDEVTGMLSEAMEDGQVCLELEFDIAESIVPSSGTFRVKLPKKRDTDIGIVVGSTASLQEPLVITDVKRGSVAHRAGTIQAGDKLLAIDGVRFDGNSTVEDALVLLLSAEDMVRLKIRKDEDDSDDAESTGAISFTVELKRYGGPLGITISGTENTFDPIIVSALTPGGIAQRTGAIHKGDQILSINNVPLRAKRLSEAIRLLQTAGETATLKIRKQVFGEVPAPTSSRQHPRSAAMLRNSLMKEPIAELSDPEDDVAALHTESAQAMHQRFSNLSQPTAAPDSLVSDSSVSPKADVTDRIGPAGASSVDSAVRSLERTPSDTHSHCTKVQVHSMPSTSSTKLAPDEPTHHSNNAPKRIDSLRAKFESIRSVKGSAKSAGQEPQKMEKRRDNVKNVSRADWQNALLDLQSVGQSMDVVADLEESMAISSTLDNLNNAFKQRPHLANNPRSSVRANGQSYSSTPSVQLHRITLQKTSDYDDFGFSVSDGQLERGVYVHSTRRNGPADRAGIRPYDRLLQVNGIRTRDFDCCHTIPLIAQAGKRVVLVIARLLQNIGTTTPLLAPPMSVPSTSAMRAGAFETI